MDCPKEVSDFLFNEFSKCQNLPVSMFYKIDQNRRCPTVINFTILCMQLIAAYKNWSYNSDYNGEFFLLQRMKMNGISINTIFDVGANTGDWSLKAAEYFPNAQIHCFEIVPDTFETLSEKVPGQNAFVNNFGLLNYNGDVDVTYFPNRSEFSSVIRFPHDEEHLTVKARVMKGDDYMSASKIEHIDFLKLDVEGAEPTVLDGFSDSIAADKIDIIQFEYGKINIVTRHLLLDFYEYFTPKGYLVGKIYPNYVDFRDYEYDDEDFFGPCYLAVSKRRQDIINILGS